MVSNNVLGQVSSECVMMKGVVSSKRNQKSSLTMKIRLCTTFNKQSTDPEIPKSSTPNHLYHDNLHQILFPKYQTRRTRIASENLLSFHKMRDGHLKIHILHDFNLVYRNYINGCGKYFRGKPRTFNSKTGVGGGLTLFHFTKTTTFLKAVKTGITTR